MHQNILRMAVHEITMQQPKQSIIRALRCSWYYVLPGMGKLRSIRFRYVRSARGPHVRACRYKFRVFAKKLPMGNHDGSVEQSKAEQGDRVQRRKTHNWPMGGASRCPVRCTVAAFRAFANRYGASTRLDTRCSAAWDANQVRCRLQVPAVQGCAQRQNAGGAQKKEGKGINRHDIIGYTKLVADRLEGAQ